MSASSDFYAENLFVEFFALPDNFKLFTTLVSGVPDTWESGEQMAYVTDTSDLDEFDRAGTFVSEAKSVKGFPFGGVSADLVLQGTPGNSFGFIGFDPDKVIPGQTVDEPTATSLKGLLPISYQTEGSFLSTSWTARNRPDLLVFGRRPDLLSRGIGKVTINPADLTITSSDRVSELLYDSEAEPGAPITLSPRAFGQRGHLLRSIPYRSEREIIPDAACTLAFVYRYVIFTETLPLPGSQLISAPFFGPNAGEKWRLVRLDFIDDDPDQTGIDAAIEDRVVWSGDVAARDAVRPGELLGFESPFPTLVEGESFEGVKAVFPWLSPDDTRLWPLDGQLTIFRIEIGCEDAEGVERWPPVFDPFKVPQELARPGSYDPIALP